MSPEEKVARDAVDAARDAVNAAIELPHDRAGRIARIAAYRASAEAWRGLAEALPYDEQVTRAVAWAEDADTKRADLYQRYLDGCGRPMSPLPSPRRRLRPARAVVGVKPLTPGLMPAAGCAALWGRGDGRGRADTPLPEPRPAGGILARDRGPTR